MEKNKRISKEYCLAVTEILVILERFPKELTEKIPMKLMNFFRQIKLEDYEVPENTELSNKAKALLAMLYRNYLCSETEKQEFDKKLLENEQEYQKNLREKYNPENIFKTNIEIEENQNMRQTELIEYEKPKWYHKIFNKILTFFRKS